MKSFIYVNMKVTNGINFVTCIYLCHLARCHFACHIQILGLLAHSFFPRQFFYMSSNGQSLTWMTFLRLHTPMGIDSAASVGVTKK